MTEPSLKEESLFAQALEFESAAERAAFLDRMCGDDQALRSEVEALLRANERRGDVLDLPEKLPTTVEETAVSECPGTVIGPYKLLEQIGEGGFGVVFMAEQRRPIRRKVAFKVLKPGMDTRQVIARFEAERQALALMDHPNIARVIDGGETTSGRPYFVMELVKGLPITEFCDKSQLTTKARLELFVTVCQAVQHAHQKGIIHRDITPSNVMVTSQDDGPLVKVIDFGIAKALGQQLTDKTLYTATAQLIGTPLYMSPEQAALSGDVDTRSDIYSLGVMLYELLTETTPFDKERFKKMGYDEIRRIIREEEPPRPSAHIWKDNGGRMKDKSNCHCFLPFSSFILHPSSFQELDWIAMKCLEKDRNRRYETANALAMDVQRYLADEPVLARPVSWRERVVRWVRRRPAVTALAAVSGVAVLALVALAVGLVYSSRLETSNGRLESVNELLGQTNGQLEEALGQVQSEKAEADRQKAEARRLLYVADLHQANDSWQAKQIGIAIQRLEAHRYPRPGEEDLRGFEWYYLWRACHGDRLTMNGHSDRITAVAYGPDGKCLATAGADKAVILWNADTGAELRTLGRHNGALRGVAFSPNGKRLVSAGGEERGELKVWDVATGREELAWETPDGIVAVAFSSDGNRVALAGPDGAVRVCAISTGEKVFSCGGHKGAVTSLAFSGDGKYLASADGRSVKIWRAVDGREMHSFEAGYGIRSLAFSPDGKRLATATGSRPADVRIWDMTSGHQVVTLKATLGDVPIMIFSPDGRFLAATGAGRTVLVWEVGTGREVFTLHGHKGSVQALAFRPDGRQLLSAGSNPSLTQHRGELKVWDLEPTREPLTLRCCPGNGSLTFSPDGKWLVSTGEAGDHTVTVWDAVRGKVLRTLMAPEAMSFTTGYGPNGSVAFSPDGRWLAAAGLRGARVWNAVTGEPAWTISEHAELFRGWFSPNSQYFVLACGGGLRVLDVTTWQELHRFRTHRREDQNAWLGSVVFNPDGQTLAWCGEPETVTISDLGSGQQIAALSCPMFSPTDALAYSPDGQRLAVACDAAELIRVFDTRTRLELPSLAAATEGASSLAYSPDGLRLVSANRDGTVKLWDARTCQELLTLQEFAKDEVVMSAVFSPDGRRLAANSGDGVIKIWEPMPEK